MILGPELYPLISDMAYRRLNAKLLRMYTGTCTISNDKISIIQVCNGRVESAEAIL